MADHIKAEEREPEAEGAADACQQEFIWSSKALAEFRATTAPAPFITVTVNILATFAVVSHVAAMLFAAVRSSSSMLILLLELALLAALWMSYLDKFPSIKGGAMDRTSILVCLIMSCGLLAAGTVTPCADAVSFPTDTLQPHCSTTGSHLSSVSMMVLAWLPTFFDSCFTLSWSAALINGVICFAALLHTNTSPAICTAAIMSIASTTVRRYQAGVTDGLLSEAIREDLLNTHLAAGEANAEEWRSMLSNIAHDFKTPLSAFSNGCELMSVTLKQINDFVAVPSARADMCNELQSAEETLQTMLQISRYMFLMINRCIDYTKASHGMQLVPFLECFDVSQVISTLVSNSQHMQTNCMVELTPFSADLCGMVLSDKQWFYENLLCLLSNAIKYCHQGNRVVVRVTLQELSSVKNAGIFNTMHGNYMEPTVSDKQMQLRVEVEDAGIGVPDDMKKALFDTISHVQKISGGTGLGLYTLARRTDALGGYYGVENRSDGQPGSLFYMSIPYKPCSVKEVQRSPCSSPRGATSHSLFSSTTPPSIRLPLINSNSASFSASKDWLTPTKSFFQNSLSEFSRPPLARQSTSQSTSSGISSDTDSVMGIRINSGRYRTPSISRSSSETMRSPTPLTSDNTSVMNAMTSPIPSGCMFATSGSNLTCIAEFPLTKPAPRRILLVDDSLAIIKMTSRLLEKNGYTVDIAYNGCEALEKFEQSGPYDAIVMDIQMPIMDGIEATRQIRNLELQRVQCLNSFDIVDGLAHSVKTEHAVPSFELDGDEIGRIRSETLTFSSSLKAGNHLSIETNVAPRPQIIIGCSANSDDLTMKNAFEAGVNSFVPKPFQLDKFKEILESYAKGSVV